MHRYQPPVEFLKFVTRRPQRRFSTSSGLANEVRQLDLTTCMVVGCLEVHRSHDFARVHPDSVIINHERFFSANRHELTHPCVQFRKLTIYRIPVFLLRWSSDPKSGTDIFFDAASIQTTFFNLFETESIKTLAKYIDQCAFSEFSASWCSRTFFRPIKCETGTVTKDPTYIQLYQR